MPPAHGRDGGALSTAARPPVSVILPFHGTRAEGEAALAALGAMTLRAGDELVIADNTEGGVLAGLDGVFASDVKRSAYAARNEAAERAVNDWLLFLDADCVPRSDLLDRYFDPPPVAGEGAVAGQVLGVPDQPGLVPRYIRSRRHLDQAWLQEHPYRPMAVTANLLVRREALEAIGGYAEGTRSGADADFCWRLLDAGWELGFREQAFVHHVHRDTLRALLAQSARDGAGGRWLSRRHPGFAPHAPLGRGLVRSLAGVAVWLVRGQPERALFKALDLLHTLAAWWGAQQSNAAPTPAPAGPVRFVAEFPATGARGDGRVEALRRPAQPDWHGGRAVPAHWSEDEGAVVRLRALVELAARRPASVRGVGFARALTLAPAAARLSSAGAIAAEPGRLADARAAVRLAGRTDEPHVIPAGRPA